MQYSAIVITAISSVTAVQALGINCRGSSNCASQGNVLTTIYNQILNLNQGIPYVDGQHITCSKNTCAFFQNLPVSNTYTAGDAAGHVKSLLDHGCSACGSDPLDGNDVLNGELTVNWVTSPS
ncbi:hypothetical protein IMSHALPRED_011145 [Imshaugia aleurites]|uniref:Killer toxin Kp4 domain-containing protein n=1 Tax=Imshaugia aleurites TaxID=172621 RepID=A0A8H3GA81_9LECA|nr:hypothetical protein IMSHALPRED_011145 [Imshaugia aleurites]